MEASTRRALQALRDRVQAFAREQQLWNPGDRLVLGVSGGADSLCMLAILTQLAPAEGISLVVAHLHHGMRFPAGDEDRDFVAAQASAVGAAFEWRLEDIPARAARTGTGVEQAGRQARREFLDAVAAKHKAAAIATGHTRTDHAETVLMHILRGTGIRGLAGIPPHGFGGRIRPILCLSRDETEHYCRLAGLSPRHDATNDDPSYLRRRLRHEVLPLIRERVNPAVDDALVRLAETAAAAETVLSDAGRALLAQARSTQAGLYQIAPLTQALPGRAAAAAVQEILETELGGPDRYGYHDIQAVLRLLTVPGAARLTGGSYAQSSAGWLRFTPARLRGVESTSPTPSGPSTSSRGTADGSSVPSTVSAPTTDSASSTPTNSASSTPTDSALGAGGSIGTTSRSAHGTGPCPIPLTGAAHGTSGSSGSTSNSARGAVGSPASSHGAGGFSGSPSASASAAGSAPGTPSEPLRGAAGSYGPTIHDSMSPASSPGKAAARDQQPLSVPGEVALADASVIRATPARPDNTTADITTPESAIAHAATPDNVTADPTTPPTAAPQTTTIVCTPSDAVNTSTTTTHPTPTHPTPTHPHIHTSTPPYLVELVAVGALVVRHPRPGDRMRPRGRGGSRKLADLLQERRIPRWDRPLWPVVEDERGILWVPLIGLEDRPLESTGETQAVRVRLEWRRP